MAEDGMYRRVQVRSRGCNESFRAAVDRSYEAPHNPMEPGMIITFMFCIETMDEKFY